MYSICIIEDEYNSLSLTANYLERSGPNYNLVGTATKFSEGVKLVETLKPDILILDLMLGDAFGLDITINTNYQGEIIIVSAHSQYGILAIKQNVCDYLLKPLNFNEFSQALDKASQRIISNSSGQNDYKVIVNDRTGMKVLSSGDIIYLQADGNYTKVHTQERIYLLTQRLGDLLNSLPTEIFMRNHKSYVVNISYIDTVLKYNKGLKLKNGVIVPTTRGFKLL